MEQQHELPAGGQSQQQQPVQREQQQRLSGVLRALSFASTFLGVASGPSFHGKTGAKEIYMPCFLPSALHMQSRRQIGRAGGVIW